MLLQFLVLLFMHPMHVSVTEIQYNEKNRSLEIISRIFIDDLQLAIQGSTQNGNLELLTPGTGVTTDQLVTEYLRNHFRVRLDGKVVNANFIAHEIDDAAMICYLEIENVKKINVIEITNSVIQEIHSDQSNLVHVTYKGPIKSMRLIREKPTGSLELGK